MKHMHLLSILFVNLFVFPVGAETCYFDNLGRLKKSQISESKWTEYKYDKDTQNIISKTQHYTDYGKQKTENTWYKYDKKGNLIEKFNDNKEFGYKFVYTYDDNGRLVSLDDSGGMEPPHTYTYDDKGHKISETNSFYKDTVTKYEYDSNGRQIASTTYDKDGEQRSKSTEQYDKKGNRIGSTTKFTDGVTSMSFVYNDKNQMISMNWSNKFLDSAELTTKTLYRYDNDNLLVEEIEETNGQKSIKSYSYDKQGNLLTTHRNGYLDNTFVWDNPNWKNKVSQSDWYGWLKYNEYLSCDPRPITEKNGL